MIYTYPFFKGNQANANSIGLATIIMGPVVANEDWHITHMEVNNPGPNIPTVVVYKNVIAPSGFVDQTINGLFGNSDTIVDLIASETVIFVWTRCTPLTACNITLRGERYVDM